MPPHRKRPTDFPLEALQELLQDESGKRRLVLALEDVMVWGGLVGWELLGRPVNILFQAESLGFTYPPHAGEPIQVFVNPRVLAHPRGSEMLKGLILHELGHHWAHFSDEGFPKANRLAKRRRLKNLLNLVGDEHMERRLRSRSPEWGEYLDALASWVFKGKPVELSLADFASALGFPSEDEAAQALFDGLCPGEVVGWEWGYAIRPLGLDWISLDAFVHLLFQELQRRRKGALSPLFWTAEAEIRKAAQERRGEPGGILDLILNHLLFRKGYDQTVTMARVSIAPLLSPLEEEESDPDLFLDRLRARLDPVLNLFPNLERYLRELEVARGSPWFWPKQRTMVHNLHKGFDFGAVFVPSTHLSADDLKKILGEDAAFDPLFVVQRILEEWCPVPTRNLQRPYRIRLRWVDVLAAPVTSPMTRFMVSLRLGVGTQPLSEDPIATAALNAVPRKLKNLDVFQVFDVTQEVAEHLGEEALDPEEVPGQPGRGAGGRGGSQSGAPTNLGEILQRIQADARGQLRSAARRKDMDESVRDALGEAERTAAKRISDWLRTGLDPETRSVGRRATVMRRPTPQVVIATEGSSPARAAAGDRERQEEVVGLPAHFLNIAETCGFDVVRRVGHPPQATDAYQKWVDKNRALIRSMRKYLAQLGSGEEDVFGQRSGRRIDPAVLQRMALTNDPRVLVGREDAPGADLFLGLAIDCSGSMSYGESMDRAVSYGIVLLEAAKGLSGISCRAIGFEDEILYDLGGAGDTSIAGLQPGAGNNDAAGLLYLAHLAEESRKHRKVLVMISDGYPTECSLESLRTLVRTLSARHRMACAQIAVAELEDTRSAFPDFTDLSTLDPARSVAHFGAVLQRLITRQYGG